MGLSDFPTVSAHLHFRLCYHTGSRSDCNRLSRLSTNRRRNWKSIWLWFQRPGYGPLLPQHNFARIGRDHSPCPAGSRSVHVHIIQHATSKTWWFERCHQVNWGVLFAWGYSEDITDQAIFHHSQSATRKEIQLIALQSPWDNYPISRQWMQPFSITHNKSWIKSPFQGSQVNPAQAGDSVLSTRRKQVSTNGIAACLHKHWSLESSIQF